MRKTYAYKNQTAIFSIDAANIHDRLFNKGLTVESVLATCIEDRKAAPCTAIRVVIEQQEVLDFQEQIDIALDEIQKL